MSRRHPSISGDHGSAPGMFGFPGSAGAGAWLAVTVRAKTEVAVSSEHLAVLKCKMSKI